MILFPLITLWIWLQVFASTLLPERKPALISDVRPKAKQDRPDDGNPIQSGAELLRHSQNSNQIDLTLDESAKVNLCQSPP